MAQMQRRLRVARIDDREAGEPVGMAANQVGEVLVGARQRRRVVEREAFAQEWREQDADIDAGERGGRDAGSRPPSTGTVGTSLVEVGDESTGRPLRLRDFCC